MASEETALPFSTFAMADHSIVTEGGDPSPPWQSMDLQRATAEGCNGPAGSIQGRNGISDTAQGRIGTAGTTKGRNGIAGTLEERHGTADTLEGRNSTAGTTQGRNGISDTAQGHIGTAGTTQRRNGRAGTIEGRHGTADTLEGSNGTAGSTQGRHGTASFVQGRNGTSDTAQGRNGTAGTPQSRTRTAGSVQGRNGTACSAQGRNRTEGSVQGRNGTEGTTQGRTATLGCTQGGNGTTGTVHGRNDPGDTTQGHNAGNAQGGNEAGGLRARAASVYVSAKVRGRAIVVNIKHSVLSSLPRDRDDVDGWTKLLLGFIYCLFIVLGLAGFSLGVLERGSLQTTRLTEPVFMLDSVEALERSSMITIVVSVLFTLAGFLGGWGTMAKKRFLLTVHYMVLVLTLAPVIYHGFGQEAASGLIELNTKSPTMRIKLTHELTQDYSLDKVCGPPGVVCTTKKWDTIQATRGCCGIAPQNANIYLETDWFKNSTHGGTTTAPRVPKSCCARTQSGRYVNVTRCQMATTDVLAKEARYSVGCDDMQAEDLRSMQLRLCVLSLLLALIALLLLILTLINNAPMTRDRPYRSRQ